MGGGWLIRVTAAVLVKPWLVPTALRQIWRLRRTGWWRKAPFVPVPDPAYLKFRLVTAYGNGNTTPAQSDVLAYLRWCRAWPHIAGA